MARGPTGTGRHGRPHAPTPVRRRPGHEGPAAGLIHAIRRYLMLMIFATLGVPLELSANSM